MVTDAIAVRLWAILRDTGSQDKLSIDYLALECRTSVRRIRRALAVLEEAGLIRTYQEE